MRLWNPSATVHSHPESTRIQRFQTAHLSRRCSQQRGLRRPRVFPTKRIITNRYRVPIEMRHLVCYARTRESPSGLHAFVFGTVFGPTTNDHETRNTGIRTGKSHRVSTIANTTRCESPRSAQLSVPHIEHHEHSPLRRTRSHWVPNTSPVPSRMLCRMGLLARSLTRRLAAVSRPQLERHRPGSRWSD